MLGAQVARPARRYLGDYVTAAVSRYETWIIYCGLITIGLSYAEEIHSSRRGSVWRKTYAKVIYDAFANRCIARSRYCASPEVSGTARSRAIFSFHLLRIYG